MLKLFSKSHFKAIIAGACLCALCIGCASQPKGMRKRRKRDCNCPSFSIIPTSTDNYRHV